MLVAAALLLAGDAAAERVGASSGSICSNEPCTCGSREWRCLSMTELDLTNMYQFVSSALSGTIPSQIARLTDLRSISVHRIRPCL